MPTPPGVTWMTSANPARRTRPTASALRVPVEQMTATGAAGSSGGGRPCQVVVRDVGAARDPLLFPLVVLADVEHLEIGARGRSSPSSATVAIATRSVPIPAARQASKPPASEPDRLVQPDGCEQLAMCAVMASS